ncbi:MAG TPA: glycosyltransferase family 39 protein [Candidatus Acidoferrales bacterium]|nr:glycosyltransferase family 39 protein [Candidatus Acidoferrales bacterium]
MASVHAQSAAPETATAPSSRWTSGPAVVAYLALGTLALHLVTAGRYDYFRDELYYIACSKHLAFGYVDQPPLVVLVVWLTRHLLGSSLEALRLPAGVAGAALVWLTGRLARDLGGTRFAQVLAAICVIVAPVYLVLHYLMTMNAFEPLLWAACSWLVIRIIQTGEGRLWLWFGALAGIGLENKYSIAVFLLGIVVGLLAGGERRQFRSEWIWLGGALALLIFLPNLVWEVANGWPFLQLMHNIRASGRDLWPGTFGFFVQQWILMNLLAAPVWLAGLWYFFYTPEGRPYRALGWGVVVVYVAFFVLHGKSYYVVPVYPTLFAGGAVVWDRYVDRTRRVWLRPAAVALLAVAGALFLPMVLPVLPLPATARYIAAFPVKPAATERSHLAAALPQYFADQFGWREMTAAAASAYWSLPAADRARAAIIGNDYGQSAAIDFFGLTYGLPPAIGVHQNYWLWGPGKATGEVLIVLGDSYEGLSSKCDHVAVGAYYDNPYGLEHDPVLICYGLGADLHEWWPQLKKWD